jgi:hypothetical protein
MIIDGARDMPEQAISPVDGFLSEDSPAFERNSFAQCREIAGKNRPSRPVAGNP